LQRTGALTLLEADKKGNKKVYALTEREYSETSGELGFRPVGKIAASTFFGFCGKHDKDIFLPIETNPDSIDLDSDEHCFLLSFRAFAIANHRKKQDIKLFSNQSKDVTDSVKELFGVNDIESQLHFSQIGLSDSIPHKKVLIEALFNKDYSELDFLTYEINYTVPFAVTSDTTPTYLFSGKAINMSEDPRYKYSSILITVIPLLERTIVVLAAFKSDPHGSAYLDELSEMNELSFERAVSWHILTNCENTFYSPKWFDALNPEKKTWITKLPMDSADLRIPPLKYDPGKFRVNLFEYQLHA